MANVPIDITFYNAPVVDAILDIDVPRNFISTLEKAHAAYKRLQTMKQYDKRAKNEVEIMINAAYTLSIEISSWLQIQNNTISIKQQAAIASFGDLCICCSAMKYWTEIETRYLQQLETNANKAILNMLTNPEMANAFLSESSSAGAAAAATSLFTNRPNTNFDDIIGHETIKNAIKSKLNQTIFHNAHTFILLSGPPGTGKQCSPKQ